jgi:hypothetical protein
MAIFLIIGDIPRAAQARGDNFAVGDVGLGLEVSTVPEMGQ